MRGDRINRGLCHRDDRRNPRVDTEYDQGVRQDFHVPLLARRLLRKSCQSSHLMVLPRPSGRLPRKSSFTTMLVRRKIAQSLLRRLLHRVGCGTSRGVRAQSLLPAVRLPETSWTPLDDGRDPSHRVAHHSQEAPSIEGERQAFCAMLTAARTRSGLTLAAIAASTKVRESLLAGLERNDLRAWPIGIFRRALFRDYARTVGVPLDPAVAEFVHLFPDPET